MNILRIGGIAAATLFSAALLVGCGSSSSSSDTSAATTTAMDTTAMDTTAMDTTGQKVGGMATCDEASIGKAVAAVGTKSEPVVLVTQSGSFKCADGWAYAYANAGTGNDQFTETLVFEAEGQFWIPKSRQKVCIAPGNQVPKSIYQAACGTN